jgi:hypothetical protein
LDQGAHEGWSSGSALSRLCRPSRYADVAALFQHCPGQSPKEIGITKPISVILSIFDKGDDNDQTDKQGEQSVDDGAIGPVCG